MKSAALVGMVAVVALPARRFCIHGPGFAIQPSTILCSALDDTCPERRSLAGDARRDCSSHSVEPEYPPEVKAAKVKISGGTRRRGWRGRDQSSYANVECGNHNLAPAVSLQSCDWRFNRPVLHGRPVEAERLHLNMWFRSLRTPRYSTKGEPMDIRCRTPTSKRWVPPQYLR